MQRTRPVALVFAAVSGCVVVAASCLRDAPGPASLNAFLALQPVFANGAAGLVDVDRIRVLLTRQPGEDVVINQVFDVSGDEVDLSLQVVIASPEDVFVLTLALISPQGDTVFRFGPAEVTATPNGEDPAPIPVELAYTGIGFDAAGVAFVASPPGLGFGEQGQVDAEAVDDEGAAIPGTPIFYVALDPTLLVVLDGETGDVAAQTEAGIARVEAQLLTGQTDTVTIAVGSGPNEIIIVSGNNQGGQIERPLLFPVVVQVLAGQRVPAPGVEVQFAAGAGSGSFSPATVTTGEDGMASSSWTLGDTEGPQTGTASVVGIPNLSVDLAAVGEPAPPPGRDVVVFNDINIFITPGSEDPNNLLLYQNLVVFTAPGPRDAGTVVWWDNGRSSACGGACAVTAMPAVTTAIGEAGLTIVEIASESGSLIDIPADVKVVFLWTPTIAYTAEEITELKRFSADGGRIIFVGEHDGFYATGIPIENQFLLDMGAQMTNTGGQIDCGFAELPATSLRSEHQIMTGITQLTIACASVIEPGPQDFALFYDLSNTFLLGGVATVDITTPGPSPARAGLRASGPRRAAPPTEATDPTSPTGRP